MISVALCTYNGERYIRQQLDSILAQTMPVDEIVVHDDRSKDSTCLILESYATKYQQIRIIKNKVNVGHRMNFEKALIECQGDYIFFSDQDDIWETNKVEISVAYLNRTGMYGVYTDGQLIDQNGNRLNETIFSRLKLLPYIDCHLLDKYEFEIICLNGNHVTGATLAITKAAKNLVLPFRTSKYILHDMWIAVKLSSINKFGFINQPLISYRLHTGQECGLDIDPNNTLIDCFLGNGQYDKLLILRKHTYGLIYFCKFDRKERKRIFDLYKQLYYKCLNKKNFVIATLRFLYIELFVFVKYRTGFRIR